MPAPLRAESSYRALVPPAAAADRWLTLALYRSAPRFEAHAPRELAAHWLDPDGAREDAEAFAFVDSVVGPSDPIRVHVPTPRRPGAYRLRVDFPEFPIEAKIEVSDRPTSFDTPIEGAAIRLREPGAAPARVRAGAAFRLEVEVEARTGPILLASSRHRLPPRRGETAFWYAYRRPGQPLAARRALERSALAADLVPGERQREDWYLQTPARPGHYELLVALEAVGLGADPPRWTPLLRDLEVAPD